MATQEQRRRATRDRLIAAARDCFVEQGFEATSTDAILKRAGVSKGALYHHFASKADVLVAVFEGVTRELVDVAQAAAQSGTQDEGRGGAAAEAQPLRAALGRALKAWLRAVLSPVPRRIILEAGPAVLGLARARQIEDAITQPPIRALVEAAVARGEAQCADVDLAARVLSAAVGEIALTALNRGLSADALPVFDGPIDDLVAAMVRSGQ